MICRTCQAGLLLAVVFFFCVVSASRAAAGNDDSNKYLFICADDQARSAPDFLAVINFDQESSDYGQVIATAPFAAPDASGNEPHHIGLSSDGNVVACGGLLSVLKGQKEIFFFDVSNPAAPKFISAANPPLSAITDEFHALREGGFLVTMMGGPKGHAPGRVVAFDKDLQLLKEYPDNPPSDGFNPHGISVRPELNLMVTSDFVCPSTTLDAVHGDIDFRGSIRVWDLKNKEIVRTIKLPGQIGAIDVRLIPHDRMARAYTAGMLDDHLYLIDTQHGTAKAVFDFSQIQAGGWPQLMRVTRDGRRLFVSMNQAGKIAMFDISNPDQPKLLKALDLGQGSGPHYLTLTEDEKRLVVKTTSERSTPKGDHKIQVAQVTKNDWFSIPTSTTTSADRTQAWSTSFKRRPRLILISPFCSAECTRSKSAMLRSPLCSMTSTSWSGWRQDIAPASRSLPL